MTGPDGLRWNLVQFAQSAANKGVESAIEKQKSFEPWNTYDLTYLQERLVEEFLEWASEVWKISPTERKQFFDQITRRPSAGWISNGILVTHLEIDELHDVGCISSYLWKALKIIEASGLKKRVSEKLPKERNLVGHP